MNEFVLAEQTHAAIRAGDGSAMNHLGALYEAGLGVESHEPVRPFVDSAGS